MRRLQERLLGHRWYTAANASTGSEIWVLGLCYKVSADSSNEALSAQAFEEFLLDFSSRIWITYRKEDGISQTILTLPLKQQQSILLSWYDRFSSSGDDCPNLQKAFEAWWRCTSLVPAVSWILLVLKGGESIRAVGSVVPWQVDWDPGLAPEQSESRNACFNVSISI